MGLRHIGVSRKWYKIESIREYYNFQRKKETMVVDGDPFPAISLVNTSAVKNLRETFAAKKAKKIAPKIKEVWIPK